MSSSHCYRGRWHQRLECLTSCCLGWQWSLHWGTGWRAKNHSQHFWMFFLFRGGGEGEYVRNMEVFFFPRNKGQVKSDVFLFVFFLFFCLFACLLLLVSLLHSYNLFVFCFCLRLRLNKLIFKLRWYHSPLFPKWDDLHWFCLFHWCQWDDSWHIVGLEFGKTLIQQFTSYAKDRKYMPLSITNHLHFESMVTNWDHL